MGVFPSCLQYTQKATNYVQASSPQHTAQQQARLIGREAKDVQISSVSSREKLGFLNLQSKRKLVKHVL